MSEYTDQYAAIRHYSALRFAMLSIFVAITGALMNAKFSLELTARHVTINLPFFSSPFYLIDFIGVWVSLVFLTFEVALNFYLYGLWAQLPAPSITPVYRRWFIVWPVRLAALSIPVGAGIMWSLL